jgi:hypothetical protein
MKTFTRDTLVNGEPAQIKCVDIAGQTYSISGSFLKTVRLEDEWFEDVRDPPAAVSALKKSVNADVFTFWQRLETRRQFEFDTEWETIALVPVTSFDHWVNKQIKPTARNKFRKALKNGLEIREVSYDDEFVRGMTEIFNETPVRQGRRFWHYGKDFETVKRQFSRYLFREDLVGAYYRDELIGFLMLGDAGTHGVIGQILSKLQHRDKAPNNALIAKAIELCERRRWSYLVYAYWPDGPLAEFKRSNGFEQRRLPRYYVPLTRRGQFAVRLGLHRSWKDRLPDGLRTSLKNVRRRWLTHRLTAPEQLTLSHASTERE